MFDEQIINDVWNKGLVDDRYNPELVRKDACGAWIIRDKYNDRENPYGWVIDHIYPKSKLEKSGVPLELIDNIVNLRPLNWKNNDSKGADFPHYQAWMKAGVVPDGEGNELDVNIDCVDEKGINDEIQKQLKEHFKGYRL